MIRRQLLALTVLAVLTLVPALVMVPVAHATGVSQIVLSCSTPPPESKSTNACSSSELVATPPIIIGGTLYVVGGYWIWCQSPLGSGTPYGNDCAGSVYVEEVNLATGAGQYDATSINGFSSATGPTGIQVSFTSSDGDMSCVLNVPASPTNGGTNVLSGICDGVNIEFSNAVVHVT